MFGLGSGYTVAIFYFSSEVEQFLYDYSIGSLCSVQCTGILLNSVHHTVNGVKKKSNAHSALLGPLKV